jgi:hypothetical protein
MKLSLKRNMNVTIADIESADQPGLLLKIRLRDVDEQMAEVVGTTLPQSTQEINASLKEKRRGAFRVHAFCTVVAKVS